MQNKRLNFDKIKNSFKNIKAEGVISTILVIALVVTSLGLLSSIFGSSSGGSSGGSSSNKSSQTTTTTPTTPTEPTANYTIVFNANGGEGEMENQTVALSGNTTAKILLKANAFTKADDWYFTGWNTKADGSGNSYTDGQYISVSSNMTLYAQWTKDVTISYYKIYACDWSSVYPPAENSGPVAKDGEAYYLRVTLDGQLLEGLGDNFTVNDETSPVRTVSAKVGSQVYIQLINKGDYDRGAVYVNDTKVAGNSEYCYYTFTVPDASEITMTFTWETEGTTLTGDAQSYWICRIYYS